VSLGAAVAIAFFEERFEFGDSFEVFRAPRRSLDMNERGQIEAEAVMTEEVEANRVRAQFWISSAAAA
jgi:hypothetical protein